MGLAEAIDLAIAQANTACFSAWGESTTYSTGGSDTSLTAIWEEIGSGTRDQNGEQDHVADARVRIKESDVATPARTALVTRGATGTVYRVADDENAIRYMEGVWELDLERREAERRTRPGRRRDN